MKEFVTELEKKMEHIDCAGIKCDDCPGRASRPCAIYQIQTLISAMATSKMMKK